MLYCICDPLVLLWVAPIFDKKNVISLSDIFLSEFPERILARILSYLLIRKYYSFRMLSIPTIFYLDQIVNGFLVMYSKPYLHR